MINICCKILNIHILFHKTSRTHSTKKKTIHIKDRTGVGLCSLILKEKWFYDCHIFRYYVPLYSNHKPTIHFYLITQTYRSPSPDISFYGISISPKRAHYNFFHHYEVLDYYKLGFWSSIRLRRSGCRLTICSNCSILPQLEVDLI